MAGGKQEAGKLDDLRRKWRWFLRFVYKHRVTWWIWPALAVLTTASGGAGFKLLQWISWLVGGDFNKWMQSPGPWMALIVLAGLPGAVIKIALAAALLPAGWKILAMSSDRNPPQSRR